MFNTDNLINLTQIDIAIKTFYYTTNLNISFIDCLGDTLIESNSAHSFCTLFQNCTKDHCPCITTHLYSGKQSEHLGESYVFMCPTGLTHIAMAITFEGVFRGFFLSGPFLMTEPDELNIKYLYEKYKLDNRYKEDFNKHIYSLPIIPPDITKYYANAIKCLAESIMLKSSYDLQEKNERYMQQRKINENLQTNKHYNNVDYSYPFEKEKQLINCVKSGQTRESSAILNELLGHILFSHGNDLNIIKARVLELCTVISRVTLESTHKVEETLSLNAIFLQKLVEADTLTDLAFILQKIIKEFSENVLAANNSASFITIRKAVNYLHTYYAEEISLNKISKIVNLTPTYFSAIFKKETGYSFSAYLNKVRIDQAKLLLLNTSLSVLEIAIEVGFDTDTYFCTVFKKFTTLTPKQYRNSVL
ncbi:MAG: hypothetical protein BEN19_05165 [Epulopiscium sp. Nuni2H_MBin003]|nr:MAG: hypothetical protein BEN19_05165 [Epulopiscium sp. Nuni2H_MBin003]